MAIEWMSASCVWAGAVCECSGKLVAVLCSNGLWLGVDLMVESDRLVWIRVWAFSSQVVENLPILAGVLGYGARPHGLLPCLLYIGSDVSLQS